MPTCWRTLASNVRAFSMVVLAALPAACGPYSPIEPTVSFVASTKSYASCDSDR
jgi:hypothetical protein